MNEDAITRLERRLGGLLLGGVVTATVVLAAGLALVVAGRSPGVARFLLTAGFLVLMATPMLRVVVSLVEYARARDWFFVATTLAVLAVLTTTIVAALLQV